MTPIELAIEALEAAVSDDQPYIFKCKLALAELRAQPAIQYDKTEMNAFVQALYDQKMQEGKHGHYETMYHVVHKAIARAQPNPPPECQTEGEKTAYAFGWWKGIESVRMARPDHSELVQLQQDTYKPRYTAADQLRDYGTDALEGKV